MVTGQGQDDRQDAQREDRPEKPRRGHTLTAEDRRKAVEVRRRKARERQAENEHAARTVHERAAVALAKLTQQQLDDAVQAMAREAAAGKVQAFKALLDYLRLAQVEESDPEAPMSPEDRAQILAEIDRWRQPGAPLADEFTHAREPDPPESSDGTHPPER